MLFFITIIYVCVGGGGGEKGEISKKAFLITDMLILPEFAGSGK